MKYGVHFATYANLYSDDLFEFYLKSVKGIGADLFEVKIPDCFIDMNRSKIAAIRQTVADSEMAIMYTTMYPPEADPASAEEGERNRAVDYMSRAIRGVAMAGGDTISCILHEQWPPVYSDRVIDAQLKQDNLERSKETLRRITKIAEQENIQLNCEILNRFEGYLLNTVQEGIAYCKDVGSDNLKLLLDIFHMNIEEEDINEAIRTAAANNMLGHLHISSSTRNIPSDHNRINWAAMGRLLGECGYDGGVTIEAFLSFDGEHTYLTRLWRNLSEQLDRESIDRQLSAGLACIKRSFQAV